MEWFTNLQKKLRDLITAALWIVFVIVGAVYTQINNVVVAVISAIFFIASIIFTVFAVKANKAEKQKHDENTYSETEKNTATMHLKETKFENKAFEQIVNTKTSSSEEMKPTVLFKECKTKNLQKKN